MPTSTSAAVSYTGIGRLSHGMPGVGDVHHTHAAARSAMKAVWSARVTFQGVAGGVGLAQRHRVARVGHVNGNQAGRPGGNVGDRLTGHPGYGHGPRHTGHPV